MTKKFGFTLALITAVLLAILILGSRAIQVSALESRSVPEKHYIRYEVQPGDSLWSLAEEYRIGGDCTVKEYISEMKKLNGLSSDRIISGSQLFLICYD